MLSTLLRVVIKPAQTLIHPDFRVPVGGWQCNWEEIPRDLKVKARVAFKDPALLEKCPFYAALSANDDASVPYPYVALAYGRHDERGALEIWSRQFPFADAHVVLDGNDSFTKPKAPIRTLSL